MNVVRMLRDLFADPDTADQSKPTDQAVSNKFHDARKASIDRQRCHAASKRDTATTIDGMVQDVHRQWRREEVFDG